MKKRKDVSLRIRTLGLSLKKKRAKQLGYNDLLTYFYTRKGFIYTCYYIILYRIEK
jgi:hypothetical protein